MLSRSVEESRINSRKCFCSFVGPVLRNSWVKPIMALSGVRSSWLMLARNCDLAALAASAAFLAMRISETARRRSTISAFSSRVRS